MEKAGHHSVVMPVPTPTDFFFFFWGGGGGESVTGMLLTQGSNQQAWDGDRDVDVLLGGHVGRMTDEVGGRVWCCS